MSWIKRHMEEIEERGYGDTDKVVCAGCFEDHYLKKKIREEGIYGKCSFCGSYRNVISLERILQEIVRAIKYYYLCAEEELPWDDETQDYLWGNPRDVYDIVYEDIAVELGIKNEELLNTIFNLLHNELYICDDDVHKELRSKYRLWNLCRKILNDRGISCWSVEQVVKWSLLKKNSNDKKFGSLFDLFVGVEDSCRKMGVIKFLTPRTNIFRCVRHVKSKQPVAGFQYVPAMLVGTPPYHCAGNNRMSENGDALFYGASDKITAMTEEYRVCCSKKYCVDSFSVNKRCRILDLSYLDESKCPSWLEVDRRNERDAFVFLRQFEKKIIASQEYRMTQVIAKYIQKKFGVIGIKYSSAKFKKNNGQHNNYVLFIPAWDCLDANEMICKDRVQLISHHETEVLSCRAGNKIVLESFKE